MMFWICRLRLMSGEIRCVWFLSLVSVGVRMLWLCLCSSVVICV